MRTTTQPEALSQPQPVITFACPVAPDWADFNGHMTEWRYLKMFADSLEVIMELIGCDAAYIAAGNSFFTAETHVCHTGEVHVGTEITCAVTCLKGSGKVLHVWQEIRAGDRLLATAEQVMIHVDLATRKGAPPLEPVAGNMARLEALHADLPRDARIGRAIRVR
ncbi:thioesterase family protein [Actibacterium sp. XHP0104]|uniref:thioesterase family protein n=1 Tax=Actibacterium sp. XHP0104 TaxID=2984335 RepID=UPI0021E88AAC|nr:thioesterase family protein [Actibacterium sp. XHP0104]MCV2881312.1 thioesterase family protein [Actibacterium sp. XHP0104]